MVGLSGASWYLYGWTLRGPGIRMDGLLEVPWFSYGWTVRGVQFSYGWTLNGLPIFLWLDS